MNRDEFVKDVVYVGSEANEKHKKFRKFTIWQPESLISEESLTSEPQFLCSPNRVGV